MKHFPEKIRAVLVDDERHCIDTLNWQLETYCPEIEVLATFTQPELSLPLLREENVDLVFLDVDMPEMSGFELLQHFEPIPFDVVFTTAYQEFAIRAFKFNVLDYLLKPIDKDELVDTVQKALKRKTRNITQEQLAQLLHSIQTSPPTKMKVALPTTEGLEFLFPEDIVRCESESNYTHVFLNNGRQMLIAKTLKDIEALLPDSFLRVHQSHLVNIVHINKYFKGDGGYLLLDEGTTVPVSRSKREELLRRF